MFLTIQVTERKFFKFSISIFNHSELQNTLNRMPKNTPVAVPSLAWVLGGVKRKFRIILKKLLFIHHLASLEDETLAKQVLTVQDHHDLPGMVSECKGYFKEYQLTNILKQKMTKNKWKDLVKRAIQTANANELKSDMFRKLENSELV